MPIQVYAYTLGQDRPTLIGQALENDTPFGVGLEMGLTREEIGYCKITRRKSPKSHWRIRAIPSIFTKLVTGRV